MSDRLAKNKVLLINIKDKDSYKGFRKEYSCLDETDFKDAQGKEYERIRTNHTQF